MGFLPLGTNQRPTDLFSSLKALLPDTKETSMRLGTWKNTPVSDYAHWQLSLDDRQQPPGGLNGGTVPTNHYFATLPSGIPPYACLTRSSRNRSAIANSHTPGAISQQQSAPFFSTWPNSYQPSHTSWLTCFTKWLVKYLHNNC